MRLVILLLLCIVNLVQSDSLKIKINQFCYLTLLVFSFQNFSLGLSMSKFTGKSIQDSIQIVLGHHQNGRFSEALEGYEELLTSLPNQDSKVTAIKVSLHGNAGAIYLSQGDYDAAKRHFEQSVQLQPENSVARYNLAVLLSSKLNNHAAALKHCALAIKYSPDNHKLFHLMGNIMQNLGKPEDAERYFNMAEQIASEQEIQSSQQDAKSDKVSDSESFHLKNWLADLEENIRSRKEYMLTIDAQTYTVKVLSSSPIIIEVENFINDEECEWIKNEASGKLEKSFTMGSHVVKNEEELSTPAENFHHEENPSLFRSSYNAWLPRSSRLEHLQHRLSILLGLPLPYIMQRSEDLQVVHYKPGGQFKVHQDSSHFHPRLVTALLYLNEPPQSSGETWFPYASSKDVSTTIALDEAVLRALDTYENAVAANNLETLPGIKVAATKGKAIVFLNYNAEGDIDPMAIHAGLPPRRQTVTSDSDLVEKWVANYWIQLDKKAW